MPHPFKGFALFQLLSHLPSRLVVLSDTLVFHPGMTTGIYSIVGWISKTATPIHGISLLLYTRRCLLEGFCCVSKMNPNRFSEILARTRHTKNKKRDQKYAETVKNSAPCEFLRALRLSQ
jgi:hypothetical protein